MSLFLRHTTQGAVGIISILLSLSTQLHHPVMFYSYDRLESYRDWFVPWMGLGLFGVKFDDY